MGFGPRRTSLDDPMTLILDRRVVCGHSRLGEPPVVWFQLDRSRLASLNDGLPGLTSRLPLIGIEPETIEGFDRGEPAIAFADLVRRLLDSAGHPAGPAQISQESDHPCVAFPVEDGGTALRAGDLIAELLLTSASPEPAVLTDIAAAFRRSAARRELNADARLMHDAARAAGLPTLWLDQAPFKPFEPGPHTPPLRVGLLQIGYGAQRRLVAGALPAGQSDALLESLRCRADLMPRLARAGLPIAAQDQEFSHRNTATRAVRSAERIGYPVAMKSLYKARFPALYKTADMLGPLTNEHEVRTAFEALAGPARRVWIEGWASGDPYRFLVIDGALRAVSRSSSSPDLRDRMSDSIIALAERAAAVCELPLLAGVDMLIVDPEGPAEIGNCVVTNILPDPDLVRHAHDLGNASLADHLVRTLVPRSDSARIPIIAVTGTNGKTTTCRMLQRILATRFDPVALATTGGAFIGRELTHKGDVAGATGAAWVLADDRPKAAVLETSRGGLLKLGTAFNRCDVATCLNVRADHLGYDGIDSLEAMAEVKGRLIERASEAAVLNADDPRCLAMRSRARCDRIVWVAQSADHPELGKHRARGGEAVFVDTRLEGEWLVLAKGEQEWPLMDLAEIPATMGGLLESNCFNARFAAATAWALGIGPEAIREVLAAFNNSVDDNPGRYNFFDGLPCKVLCDYAQNPDGVDRLLAVINRMELPDRMHLVCMTIGARHREHIDAVADEFSRRFATISLSGNLLNIERNPEWAGEQPRRKMLEYFRNKLIDAGTAPARITTSEDEARAVRAGLDRAATGDFLLVLAPPEVSLPILSATSTGQQPSDD